MYLKKMNELVGKTFNYLTVLEARPENKKGMVLVRCVCGKEKIVRGRSLKNNGVKSCGCKRKLYARRGKKLIGENTALTNLFSLHRTRAINKNLGFDLSVEIFKKLTSLNCYYCDTKPSNTHKKRYDTYIYNGLDRIDNSLGYIINNVVPCCYDCNTKKGAITKEMIIKLYELIK